MKEAMIFGSTGLVGHEVVRQLQSHSGYRIKTFTRRPSQPVSRVTNHVIDFTAPDSYAHLLTGDCLFCCLGSTIRKAGSREAFRAIDYGLVLNLARIAAENKVKHLLVISSIGADASSGNFYLRTKGEMEHGLQQLPFQRLSILRPSVLTGPRKEFRLGEKTGIVLATLISPLLMGRLKKYRPIHAAVVAKAMIRLSESENTQMVYESDVLQALGK